MKNRAVWVLAMGLTVVLAAAVLTGRGGLVPLGQWSFGPGRMQMVACDRRGHSRVLEEYQMMDLGFLATWVRTR